MRKSFAFSLSLLVAAICLISYVQAQSSITIDGFSQIAPCQLGDKSCVAGSEKKLVDVNGNTYNACCPFDNTPAEVDGVDVCMVPNGKKCAKPYVPKPTQKKNKRIKKKKDIKKKKGSSSTSSFSSTTTTSSSSSKPTVSRAAKSQTSTNKAAALTSETICVFQVTRSDSTTMTVYSFVFD
jgi:hypothetical protein